MPQIYVVTKSYHDYSPAEKFGEINYLSEEPIDKFSLTAMMRDMEPKLRDSSPEDLILMGGPGVMTAVACSIFACLHGKLNLLLYHVSSEGERYLPRTILMSKSKEETSSNV